MIKNDSNRDVANTVARLAYEEVYASLQATPIMQIVESYSTGSDSDDHLFGVALNNFREWVGAKEFGNFQIYKQDVFLKTYERSFELPRKQVDYDTTGAVAQMLASTIRNTLEVATESLIFSTLVSASGAGPTSFDGQALISNSHTIGDESYDNLTTAALSPSAYDAAQVAMMGWKSAAGDPLAVFGDLLIVGPKNRRIAFDIAGNPQRVAAVDNSGAESGTRVAAATVPNYFAGDNCSVLVWPRLVGTYADYWYLADTTKPSKPIILKEESDWQLIEKTDRKDDARYERDVYQWSLESDKTVAAGAPATIYGGLNAG